MDSDSRKIRVLTVDDHPLMRAGLEASLAPFEEIEVVGEASTARQALEVCASTRPDVALLDLQLPDASGIDLTCQIRNRFPEISCIILTTYGGDVHILRALKAGARGYLLKSSVRHEVGKAVTAVYRGERYLTGEIAAQIAGYLESDTLSPREIDVLAAVSDGSANKAVADQLGITEDTVKGHMRSILSKLSANDRTDAVLTAIERGFLEPWRIRLKGLQKPKR